MEIEERIAWLLLGGNIGFVLGYLVRSLREIKTELDEVDEIVKARKYREDGFVRNPIVLDAILGFLVITVAFASFMSFQASKGVDVTQERLDRATSCNTKFLAIAMATSEKRTNFIQERADMHEQVTRSEVNLLSTVLKNTGDDNVEVLALESFLKNVREYIQANQETRESFDKFKYPTAQELLECIEDTER